MAQRFNYNQQGRFRILQLTDLHYEDGGRKDQQMLNDVRNLIAWEHPDLAIITGDFVTNKDNVACAPHALAPLTESKLSFLYVFGNHDTEYGRPHPPLVKALNDLPGCMNPPCPRGIPGYSNFSMELGDADSPAEWLMMGLDSNMYNANPAVGGYDYVKPKQITWYDKQIKTRKRQGGNFGALCFMHIPIPEYAQAMKSPMRIGQKLEGVCCPEQNSGLFSAMLDAGHTRGIFVGHDHLNDACGGLFGIALCFGRAGGYSTYGRRTYPKGGRIIELVRGNTESFLTWVRLSDGSVKDRFDSRELFETDKGQIQ